MKHTTESTTHWACNEMEKEKGWLVPCCACTKHECKTITLTEGFEGSEFKETLTFDK